MFKGIKDKLKHKSALKFIQEELKNPTAVTKNGKGIKSLGVIVDLDNFENANVFFELMEQFKLRANAVKIIGYKRVFDKNSPYATPVFSDEDLGWKGKIESGYTLEFLNREYDLLLNYFAEENVMMQLMSIKTKARIRVGFKEIDNVYNDIIIDTPINDFKTFSGELKKYLHVLSEI